MSRGGSVLVRMTEHDLSLLEQRDEGEPKWQCPLCHRLQFRGFVQTGRHVTIICQRPACKATIRFEVVPDPPAIDLTVPIGRHRKRAVEPAETGVAA